MLLDQLDMNRCPEALKTRERGVRIEVKRKREWEGEREREKKGIE